MYKTKEEVRSPNKETKQSVFVRNVRPIIKSTYPMLLKSLQERDTGLLKSCKDFKKEQYAPKGYRLVKTEGFKSIGHVSLAC